MGEFWFPSGIIVVVSTSVEIILLKMFAAVEKVMFGAIQICLWSTSSQDFYLQLQRLFYVVYSFSSISLPICTII